jgi:hypothetical protein
MSEAERSQWTEADFDDLSWHDNAVHALRLVEGEYGAGQLHLDIDYILEWLRDDSDEIAFRIAPASLEFRDVTNLKVTLDYETPTAGLTPFSLDRIDRQLEQRDRYEVILWTLVVNWPVGGITFEAKGFRQFLRGPPVVSSQQQLSAGVRGDGA